LAVASAAGLLSVSTPSPGQAAPTDDAVTIAWAGGNTPGLQQFQPDRDSASVHYGDFQNVQVTVSKTTDLVDEAVTVTVTGMPGGTRDLQSVGGQTGMGANFIQAMQCWGDPDDPEFYKNCLWGAWVLSTGSAVPTTPLSALTRGGQNSHGTVPFRAVTGREYSGDLVAVNGVATMELVEVVRPETTNERSVMVDATGTAEFLFEAQSAAAQPYLGCGDEDSATGTQCWLVVVPRGAHTSAPSDGCYLPPASTGDQTGAAQENSPVNPGCDYWGNRVVVPLEFRPTGSPCPPGRAEVRISGSQGVAEAFASWQAGICQGGGTAFTLTTSSDQLVRDQFLSGMSSMAITSRPLAGEWLGEGYDPDLLADAQVVYAPVAVSGIVIAFLANKGGHVETGIRLSPRLVAKLVTHSYGLEQSLYYYGTERVPGPWITNPIRLNNDPEFTALNPDGVFNQGGTLIMTGPDSADGIAQLWAYLRADDAARAFLAGEADNVRPGDEGNAGMTLNPWYLPKGHPDAKVPVFNGVANPSGRGTTLLPQRDEAGQVVWREVGLADVDGSPLCLCDTPMDSFPKSDETELPQQTITPVQWRYDIAQVRPYASTLGAAARMVFRADKGSRTGWDSTARNGATNGNYVSDGLSNLNHVFLTGYTGAVEAAQYGLATASLGVPNSPGVFVDAKPDAMAAAVAAQEDTGTSEVAVIDPATLPTDAYPLTTLMYAAVNVNALDQAQRDQYADLIEYAVTTGQTPGSSIGQLPEGYLPLTDDLRDQALAAVRTIRGYPPTLDDDPPGDDPTDVPQDDQVDPAQDDPASAGNTTDPPEGEALADAPLGDGADVNSQPNGGPTATPSASASASSSPVTDLPGTKTSDPPESNGQEKATADPTQDLSEDNQPTDGDSLDPVDEDTGAQVITAHNDVAALPATPAVEASPARGALGGALATGVAGMVAGPLLLRRRGETP
jgi:hypothetical protein